VATATCGTFAGCYPAVSGITWTGSGAGVQVSLADGTAIDPAATYRVLVNDFMYASGYHFAAQDPAPVDTGVNYRDPVVTWTRALGSTPADPLEGHLDPTPRGQ